MPPAVLLEVTGEKYLQLQRRPFTATSLSWIILGEDWALFICNPGTSTPLENKIQFYIKKGFFHFFYFREKEKQD